MTKPLTVRKQVNRKIMARLSRAIAKLHKQQIGQQITTPLGNYIDALQAIEKEVEELSQELAQLRPMEHGVLMRSPEYVTVSRLNQLRDSFGIVQTMANLCDDMVTRITTDMAFIREHHGYAMEDVT